MPRAHERFAPRKLIFTFILAALLPAALTVPSALASEAPRYYDPLDPTIVYDPDLFPLNRPAGTMDIFFQWASRPAPGDVEQTVFEQQWWDQYRFRWHASIQEDWALFMEFKGARHGHVLPEDYAAKFDLTYLGWSAPLLPYGGVRAHREDDAILFLGVETMSFRARDIVRRPDKEYAPLALKGWAELRHSENLDTPSYRFMAMVHTLPELIEPMYLAVGMDHRFNDHLKPEWYASFQARYFVTRGLARLMLHGGYEYSIRDNVQRATLGFGINAF